MKYNIDSNNLKALGQVVQALARIGDEIYITSRGKDEFFLETFNSAKSVYTKFTFDTSFFTVLDEPEEDQFTRKLCAKTCVIAFRHASNLHKKVDQGTLDISPDKDDLLLYMENNRGVKKAFRLPYVDCDEMSTKYDKTGYCNQVSGSAKLFHDVIAQFPHNLDEVTFVSREREKFEIRNFVDPSCGDVACDVLSKVIFGRDELDEFTIGKQNCVTFRLKEFKALLNFASIVEQQIMLEYDDPGKPIVMTLSDGLIGVTSVSLLATLFPDENNTTSGSSRKRHLASTSSTQSSLMSASSSSNKRTRQEKEMISDIFNDSDNLIEPSARVRGLFSNFLEPSDHYTTCLPDDDPIFAEDTDEEN